MLLMVILKKNSSRRNRGYLVIHLREEIAEGHCVFEVRILHAGRFDGVLLRLEEHHR